MISQNLLRIANRMKVIVAYLADISSIDCNSNIFDDIPPHSFDKSINEINVKDKRFYFRSHPDSKYDSSYVEKMSLESICEEHQTFLLKEIDNIFNNPTIIYEDEELVKALSDIKNSGFFYVLKADVNSGRELRFLFEVKEFYISYTSLVKFIKPSPIVFRRATEEDLEKYYK